MLSQRQMLRKWVPALRESGIPYKKFKPIIARQAKGGELVRTVTQDGLETENTAIAGDFIIRNLTEAGEEYILHPEAFHKKYQLARPLKNGFSEYQPIGRIIALEMKAAQLKKMYRKQYFKFTAPWGAPMILRKDDFLVCPTDYSEVYRIARKEFFETYQKE